MSIGNIDRERAPNSATRYFDKFHAENTLNTSICGARMHEFYDGSRKVYKLFKAESMLN